MYRAFRIEKSGIVDANNTYENQVKKIITEQENLIKTSLDGFTLSNGSLDGSKMSKDWFPEIKADVFISHSHLDNKNAIVFAGWLKKHFGLTAFIDSTVWKYSKDLQILIDDKIKNENKKSNYNYDDVIYSSSHIHMMLASALTMMMNKTEVLFFLETPNSLAVNSRSDKTLSPWIYYEITMFKYIKKSENVVKSLTEGKVASLKIEHEVDFSNFKKLTKNDLLKWKEQKSGNGLSTLNALYDL